MLYTTFLNKIDEIITLVKTELGENNINIAEGFSGSGIFSSVVPFFVTTKERERACAAVGVPCGTPL